MMTCASNFLTIGYVPKHFTTLKNFQARYFRFEIRFGLFLIDSAKKSKKNRFVGHFCRFWARKSIFWFWLGETEILKLFHQFQNYYCIMIILRDCMHTFVYWRISNFWPKMVKMGVFEKFDQKNFSEKILLPKFQK